MSIQLTLEGSTDDMEKIENLFQKGELNNILGIPVESVYIVSESGKRKLIFEIAGNISPIVLAELKKEFQRQSQRSSQLKADTNKRLYTGTGVSYNIPTEANRSYVGLSSSSTSSDILSDMLTRIRNASSVRHSTTIVPTTRTTRSIAQVLKDEGFIDGFEEVGEGINKHLVITLKYKGKNRQPVINTLQRVSKPGLRVYSNQKNFPRVLGGIGIAIISTSQGVMTDKEAIRRGIGGEILCYVW